MSKNTFEFIIDTLKMSLQVNSGSLDKVSICVKAFGSNRGFATDQDKKEVRAAPVCTGIQKLTGLRGRGQY